MFFIDAIVILHKERILGWRFIILTEVSQVANMLLISNKISINKNKQIYFFLFFLYFSLLIFYTSPRQWGLRGDLLLAKVEF